MALCITVVSLLLQSVRDFISGRENLIIRLFCFGVSLHFRDNFAIAGFVLPPPLSLVESPKSCHCCQLCKREGGKIENYSVILHLKKNFLNTVSTNFVADCSL